MQFLTTGPLYVSWNYTYACNFNCNHCYSRADSYPVELSTQHYENVVNQIIEAKVFKVGLGGGEPLIRRDCLDVIAKLSNAGVDTNITTNGWLINDQIADKLAASGLNTLYISLDSSDEAEHDNFRNKQGSYQRVIQAMKLGVRSGINVQLSTVVTLVNFEKLTHFVEIAEHIGIKGIEFKRFRPSGNGLKSKEKYQLLEEQEQLLKEEISRIQQKSKLNIALIYGAESDGGVDSGCPCGTKSICIRPNGDVSPCAYGETVIGNLMQQSLTDIWQKSPMLKLIRDGGGCIALHDQRSPSNPMYNLTLNPLN
jgi:MoaA/NifB/PqqE/SkfB family radical SAM enzyme